MRCERQVCRITYSINIWFGKKEALSLTWLCHGLIEKKEIGVFTWEAALLANTVHLVLVCINKLPALLYS